MISLPLPPLAVSLMLAFILRVGWALLIPVNPVSDSVAYDIFATNIVEYGVYGFTPEQPGAYWAVGTAAIYAGTYMLFGTGSSLGVVTVNLLSALVVVWLLHDLGRRWFGEAEGRIAALLFALWPMAIQFTTILASEIHFMALTLAALACWDRSARTLGGLTFLVFSGVFLAGATYVRPIALLIPAILALAVVIRAPRTSGGTILKAIAATVLVFALVAPWSARNERVFGEPVFMSTNFWPNFWMGNHPGTDGEYAPLPPQTDGMSEIERAAYLKSVTLGHLRADPAGFVGRTLWKAVKLHERETIGVVWNEAAIASLLGQPGVFGLKLLSTAWWYAVLATAFAGIVLLVRRQGVWVALFCSPVWLWGYFTGIHAVIVVGDRYHMPAIPMIALIASVALAAFARWISERGREQQRHA